MSELAIRAENIGKMYHIGALQQDGGAYRYKSLRDAIAKVASTPFRAARALVGGEHTLRNPKDETFWALKDVSFEVKRGEIVGVIGRNGAGKSTLLKVMSRITEPTVGRAEIYGRVGSLLEVGTGFHPELTGRDNVFLNGAILGMKRSQIAKNFDEIVAFAEVERFIDTPVKYYSSGMYLRLAFAVAAHLEPEILIVDEVLAVGDVQFQKKCLGKMHEVGANGRTVIFVSHNMPAVLQLTSRSILLSHGSVAFNGPTEDAIARYTEGGGLPSATFFDVEDKPRNGLGTGAVRIVALWFDRAAPRFEANEDIEFAIRVRAVEDVCGLRVSMTLFSSDGTPVGSSFGPESISIPRNGTCDVNVRLPILPLAPGRYYCSVGMGRGDHTSGHTVLDGVLDTLHFEVLPEAGDSGTLSNWVSGWGNIRFPALHVALIAVPQEIQK